ncbi:uncharacterized protein LOC132200024 [Neocloeon triangulifer]|uniref:uncharacterized protein LOC132200024 n=1 Tax=Neocloeon triangulifer TaxID=2078957 RepID=UPI00286F8819|nr:uncharacterized protein LOC132200024 [Neocloeon triangulifer]
MDDRSRTDNVEFNDVQLKFIEIMRHDLRTVEERNNFLLWIADFNVNSCKSGQTDIRKPEIDSRLDEIVKDIRKRVPEFSTFPSEKIVVPTTGDNSDCQPETTVHVDGFLYKDADIDVLAEEGELQRDYCLDCGSRNVAPLTFISHSMSREKLDFVFNVMLPPNFVKKIVGSENSLCPCLLDVGSRHGGTLYSAYLHSDIEKIVGVEMNKDFCSLQREICKKHRMQDRVTIVEDDISNQKEKVKEAKLIFLNNPFEFFLSIDEQKQIWLFLKENITAGTTLICVPDLETTFDKLEMKSELHSWVKKLEPHNSLAACGADEDFADLHMYRVL